MNTEYTAKDAHGFVMFCFGIYIIVALLIRVRYLSTFFLVGTGAAVWLASANEMTLKYMNKTQKVQTLCA